MPRLYSDEFKADAVALVASGMTQKQVCADLGVSKTALSQWVRDARLRAAGMEPVADKERMAEMTVAMRRIRELEMENKVLRAAAAYLSQEVISPKGSTRPYSI